MKRIFALVLVLVLLLSGCAAPALRAADNYDAALFTPPPTLDPQVLHARPELQTETHIAYIEPRANGEFAPDEPVTRGEACQMLYALLAEPIEGNCSFADIAPEDDCYEAVAALAAWGVINDSSDNFNPDDLISRAQLFTMLSAFYPPKGEGDAPHVGSFLRRQTDYDSAAILPDIASFSDTADHWAFAAIENAVAQGWVESGGEFGPDYAVTRAQICRLLNRILGRHADLGVVMLSDDIVPYSDVPTEHEAFGDIMEASITHDYTLLDDAELWQGFPLESGFHRRDGRLYYVDKEGQLLRNQSYKNWSFDEYGRYTTGVPEVDEALAQVLIELGADDMSSWNALKAAYLYCVHGKSYTRYPWSTYGCDDDRYEYAYRTLHFIEHGSGSCYDFAAAFGLLARSLGYHCYIVFAEINQFYAPHGWVVIPSGGVNYIYDPEMEATRPERHGDLDLFQITNHSIYHYWYTPWW